MNTALSKTTYELLRQAGVERFNQNGAMAGGWSQRLDTLPRAVLEERSRMAREIHDTLAQEFAGILLHLEAVGSSENLESSSISECLARARELAKCGLEDARRMLLGLRPKSLEGANLVHALGELVERFSRDCGINCTLRAEERAREIPVETQDELYRVAQEALCNVRKHARATSASVFLGCRAGVVVLKIKDTGQGFATATDRAPGQGYGLSTMRERAQRLGGKIEIETGPGAGTEIKITVPIPGWPQNRKE
jgi:signal transduction histidine kinase